MSKPNYSGTFHMVDQVNMDAYLAALDINFALRKIVCLLKPSKEISHEVATGAMKIRTLTTFKNFNMDFTIGEEFTEDLRPVDGRTCQECLCNVIQPTALFLCCNHHSGNQCMNPNEHHYLTLTKTRQMSKRKQKKRETTVSWEGDNLVCVQRGEKDGRGWTHWLEGDKLHLEMRVQGIVAKQVFKKAN
ncbi:retinol-binding protein 5 isoform X1 [Sander vitreus]